MDPIYLSADHYVEYLDARDSADDTALNSATCTYALTTAAGVAVSGGTGTLTYVAASSGNYRGTIESTVTATLTAGSRYKVVITFSQGLYQDSRTLWYRAGVRGAS